MLEGVEGEALGPCGGRLLAVTRGTREGCCLSPAPFAVGYGAFHTSTARGFEGVCMGPNLVMGMGPNPASFV